MVVDTHLTGSASFLCIFTYMISNTMYNLCAQAFIRFLDRHGIGVPVAIFQDARQQTIVNKVRTPSLQSASDAASEGLHASSFSDGIDTNGDLPCGYTSKEHTS
ncbi:hypothetical protein CYMTET_3422 [Cymbomonas tetramitiformis]|uniref:Uncharacterized protein n=1 Tax=Cymbomonas tetramitiformis TaxID=36881 RepID=A0AAE0H359_9CHLO|nr:hypothetical protein CYMTET_3422 [Cymbomonas tetramitiformis]